MKLEVKMQEYQSSEARMIEGYQIHGDQKKSLKVVQALSSTKE